MERSDTIHICSSQEGTQIIADKNLATTACEFNLKQREWRWMHEMWSAFDSRCHGPVRDRHTGSYRSLHSYMQIVAA